MVKGEVSKWKYPSFHLLKCFWLRIVQFYSWEPVWLIAAKYNNLHTILIFSVISSNPTSTGNFRSAVGNAERIFLILFHYCDGLTMLLHDFTTIAIFSFVNKNFVNILVFENSSALLSVKMEGFWCQNVFLHLLKFWVLFHCLYVKSDMEA